MEPIGSPVTLVNAQGGARVSCPGLPSPHVLVSQGTCVLLCHVTFRSSETDWIPQDGSCVVSTRDVVGAECICEGADFN